MKLTAVDAPPEVHPTVRDHMDEVVQFANNGQIELPLDAAAPTFVPDGVNTALRVVAEPGTGNVYLFIWNSTTENWGYVQLTTV